MPRTRRGLLRRVLRSPGSPEVDRSAVAADPAEAFSADATAALEACSDGVLGLDRDGVIRLANGVSETIFGSSPGGLLGLSADRVLPGLALAIDEITARRRQGQRRPGPSAPGLESSGLTRTGRSFPVALWVSPTIQERSTLTLFVTVRDLQSARARLAAHQALREDVLLLRETMDAVGRAVRDRAIWVLDEHGHILQSNRAAEKLLGYTGEEMAGRHCSMLSDPQDLAEVATQLGTPDGVDPLLEITRSGLPNEQDWVLIGRGGPRHSVRLNIVAIGPRQQAQGYVWVATTGGEAEPGQLLGGAGRLLFDLDDAETRTLRWQVGGSVAGRRRP